MTEKKYPIFHYLGFSAVLIAMAGCGGVEYQNKPQETFRTHAYMDANDTEGEIAGLEGLSITATGALMGSVSRWSAMSIKEAPIVKTDSIKVTKANPIGASVVTLLTLGIYPLVSPKDAWATTVGKEEITNSYEAPDYSKSRRTGRIQWQERKAARKESFTVSIGGQAIQYSYNIAVGGATNFNLDLSNRIRDEIKKSGRDTVDVSIWCDCRRSGRVESAPYGVSSLRSMVTVTISRTTHSSLFGSTLERPSSSPPKTGVQPKNESVDEPRFRRSF